MVSFSDLANPGVGELPIYEPGKPVGEVARELGLAREQDVLKLASNENALGPSPMAMEAMRAMVPEMHRYPDGGAFYLKAGLAEKLDVAAGMILFGNGSNELLELIGHVFLGSEAGIVMSDHAFVVYRLVAKASGSPVVSVPMKALTHDLDAMLAAVTSETRVVFVSNPNNPTGTMVGGDEIDRFMDGVPDHVIVCFDEAYVELLAPEKQPDTLKYVREGRNVMVLRTFSKTYGLAGLRIGYGVAPEDAIRLLNRVRQPFNVNAMAQGAALAALADDAHVRRTREMVGQGLAFLMSELDKVGIPYVPAVINFMLVEVGKGRTVFEALMKKGVIVRPMDVYGLGRYVRVTVGTPEENKRFVSSLVEVMRA